MTSSPSAGAISGWICQVAVPRLRGSNSSLSCCRYTTVVPEERAFARSVAMVPSTSPARYVPATRPTCMSMTSNAVPSLILDTSRQVRHLLCGAHAGRLAKDTRPTTHPAKGDLNLLRGRCPYGPSRRRLEEGGRVLLEEVMSCPG